MASAFPSSPPVLSQTPSLHHRQELARLGVDLVVELRLQVLQDLLLLVATDSGRREDKPCRIPKQLSLRCCLGAMNFNLLFCGLCQFLRLEPCTSGPAFRAGLISGSQIQSVNGRVYSSSELKHAISDGGSIDLVVKVSQRQRTVQIECPEGHPYPHREAVEGARPRLDENPAPAFLTGGSRLERPRCCAVQAFQHQG